MFDFDVGKLLLIGVVALIFIPPKDLPEALRQLGRLVGQARRMAADFQSQFNEAMREAELTRHQGRIQRSEAEGLGRGRARRMSRTCWRPRSKRRRPNRRGRRAVCRSPKPRRRHADAAAGADASPCPSLPDAGRPNGVQSRTEERAMTQADIDATKAPLIDHLIELRARLIKALVAFLIAFALLLLFLARHLQHPARALCLGGRAPKTPS